ncbi:MAG: RNA-guided endonuclease InsQ/TnpB family protein [Acidimicrobiales bacterium]
MDKTNPAGLPRFKSKKQGYATARWTKNGFSVSGTRRGQAGDRLEVAVAGRRIGLRVVWSRPLPSSTTSVTIYRDPAVSWWASFVVQAGVVEGPRHLDGPATGLDVGLTTFATTEDPDTDIENPRYARRAAKALARSQRNMAHKRRGSKHLAKAKVQVAKVSATVADQRRDFHHKAARELVGAYDRIGVEDLRIKNMSARGPGRRKSGLNRSIADAGWGQFLAAL